MTYLELEETSEVALLTLLFLLFKLLYTDETVARMPIFIDGDGKNAIWNGFMHF